MRLLLVLNDPADFHANRVDLARAAQAAGWDVHVAAPAEPDFQRIADDGWSAHPIPLDRLGMAPHREARTVAALAGLYRRLRPQVVHLRAVKPILAGGLAARLVGGVGVVSHFCGLGYVFTGDGLRRRLLRAALAPGFRLALSVPRQRIVVLNPDDAAVLGRLGLVRPDGLRLIPGSGVDCERFRPGPPAPGPFTVVLPARLLHAKGLAEFAAAGRILRQRGADLRLRLVGGEAGANPDAVPAAQVHAWQAEGALEWTGATTDMPAVYAAAHAVCLPSWREGLPRALLEGAACGLPLVASDVPGCRAAVAHGSTGLLVPLRDPLALADALASLAADPARAAAYGRAARERALAEFATARITAAFLALYQEVAP